MKKNAQQKNTDRWGSKFFLTVNRHTITDLLTSVTLSDMPATVRGAKIAVEIGNKGNLHKHIYVALSRSVRLSWFFKNFPGCETVLVTPGTEQTVIEYIGGQEKSNEKESIVISDYTVVVGDVESSQGKRSDLSATDEALWQIKDAIDAGESKRELWQDFFPFMVRFGRGIADYLTMIQEEKDRKDADTFYELKKIQLDKMLLAEEAAKEEIEAERLLIAAIRDKALSYTESL